MGWRCCDAVPQGCVGVEMLGRCRTATALGLQARQPLGTVDPVCCLHGCPPGSVRVLDSPPPAAACNISLRRELPASTWQLWSPNKSLGLTGVRAALRRGPCITRRSAGAARPGVVVAWGHMAWPCLEAWAAPADAAMGGRLPAQPCAAGKTGKSPVAPNWAGPVLPNSLANYFVATAQCAGDSSAQTANLPGRAASTASSCATAPRLARCGAPGRLPPASQDALPRLRGRQYGVRRHPAAEPLE